MEQIISRRGRLAVTQLPVANIKLPLRNARTHTRKQILQIANSIREFGFNSPILVDTSNTVVAGHGRLAAAKELGLQNVPAICIGHLTKNQLRAYAIADNKIAELAGWDEEVLKIEFQQILDLDPDYDLTVTGFETPEIDLIILGEAVNQPPEEEDEDLDALLRSQPVSRKGDLWLLGPHRILCGDARDHDDYALLMGDKKAQLVFTDPPYNLSVRDIRRMGQVQHDDFAMAAGEQSKEEFTSFLQTCCSHMASFSMNGSIQFICMDWRHVEELSVAGRSAYQSLQNICVWNKTNGGMGSLYRSKYELVFVFKVGTAPHINNVQLGQYGRYRTNVWDYAGQNAFHTGRDETLDIHPTVKPVSMVADAILDCSNRNGIILDPFGGSGTTLLAAEKTDRQARLMEYEPIYVDLAIRRWQKQTGEEAVHAKTGKPFNQHKPRG